MVVIHRKQIEDGPVAMPDEGWWESVLSDEQHFSVSPPSGKENPNRLREHPNDQVQSPAPHPAQESAGKGHGKPSAQADAAAALSQADWDAAVQVYQQDQIVNLTVTSYNRGGLLVERSGNLDLGYRFVKRAFDIVGSALLIVALAPLMLATLAVLTVTTKGRPLFFQQRIGLCGRRFWLPKFRTMHLNADKVQHLVANEKDGPVFKNRRDPRITGIGRLLRANHIGMTVLDLDAEQVEIVRKLGIKVFYGDATRLDLLHAAGAARAKAIVIAIDDEKKSVALAVTVQRHFPHLKIFARASGRVHAYDYQKIGIESFYRETVGTSLDLGIDLMRELGIDARQAERAAQLFKQHDARAVRELAQYWEDDEAYFKHARDYIEAFERMFVSDAAAAAGSTTTDGAALPEGQAARQN